MKKHQAASALLLLTASFAGFADTADSANTAYDNFFIAGNIGSTHYRDASENAYPKYRDDLSHATGVFQNLRFGWRWNGWLGPEIGYAYFGTGKRYYNDPGRYYSVQPRAFTLGLNGRYDFYGNWFVTAHAGGLHSHTTTGCSASYVSCNTGHFPGVVEVGPPVSRSTNDYGWYGGIGVGYDVTHNVSVGINYDDYKIRYDAAANPLATGSTAERNIAAFSASLEYRF